MAKLTKQQIDAIANKALRILTKNAEKARLEAIKNYEPSEEYNELKIKLERLLEINKTTNALNKESSDLVEDINNLMTYPHTWVFKSSLRNKEEINNYLANFIINKVTISNPIPTLKELKEEITIAIINKDFDAEIFINSLIEKYK